MDNVLSKKDDKIEEIISHIKDEDTEIQVAAERGFLKGVNGSCHVPMGAYCEIKGDRLRLTGLYGDEEGNKLIIKSKEGSVENANKLGLELAEEVLKEYQG